MAEQNASNPASSAIGEVQSVTGRVVAIGADGVERQLFAGDLVYPDDLIKTSGQSSIVVALKDGTRFDLGRDAEALLDAAVYGDDVAAIKAAALADVAELQRAIAEGADPTEVAEAPAAGGSEGSAGESVQSAVGLDRTGRIGAVEAGFETRGVEQAIDPIVIDPIDFGLGAEPSSTSGGAAPVALVLTVSAPDNTNDNTPTITGTTDAAAGSTVTLAVIDSAGDSQNLVATVQTDGTYSVEVAAALPEGDYTVDASVSDVDGNTASASDPGSVNAVNDAPTAIDDVYSTNEGSTLTVNLPNGVLVNDNDLDGDSLTVNTTPVTDVVSGALTLNGDGTFTYVPNPNWSGMDQFTYEVSDGNGGTAQATVFIDVAGANGEPVAVDDTGTTDEDVSLNIDVLANDTDLDLDTLSVSSVTQGANGSVIDNGDGTVAYTPNANFNGIDSFTYTITDGNGGTDTATVNVRVDPANDVPVALDDTGTTDEDVSLNIDVLANDTDLNLDTLSVSGVTQGANGNVIDNGDGTVTYTPNANFNGADSFTYTITDGNGGTDTATVNVTVDPTNDVPVAVDDAYSTDEDTTLTVSLPNDVLANDNDLDGDSLTVNTTPVTDVANGTLTLNGDGTFTYVPNADFNGSDSFVYEVSDGNGGTAQATVTIGVNAVNDAPTAVGDAYSTDEDTTLTVSLPNDVLANDNDLDGDTLTVNTTPVTDVVSGTLTLNGDGTFTYVPNADFNGSDSFVYEVSDGNGGTAQATVTIGVNAVNDAPTAVGDAYSTDEDTTLTVSLPNDVLANDNDLDGDTLTVNTTPVTDVVSGTLTLNGDGTFTYVPNSGWTGIDQFAYEVSDGNGGTAQATVFIDVGGVNDAPVANDDSLAASEDTPVTYSAADLLGNDSDVDGPSLSIASVTSGTGGTAVLNVDGTVTFTPNADFNGDADFTYTVTDGTLTSNTATVTVGVAAVNDAPVANDDSLAASEDTPVTYSAADLLGNDSDVDGPSLSIASVTSGTGGTAVLNVDGTVTFTPNADFNGDADFTYTVTDGTLTSNTATVTVGVAAVNDAPVANDDSLAASEDTPVTYSAADLLGNDSDVDGPSLSIASVTSGTGGTAVLNVDGTVTFTPNADFNGDADFTYTVTDGTLTSNTATVTVGVAAVNDAPVANDDSLAASEDTPVTYSAADLLGNDSDVDGPSLSIASVTSGTGGTAVLNVDGTVTFTPNADFNGDADFTYTVTDGTLTSNTATVTVGVAAVNDAPVANDDSLAASEDTPVTYSAADLLGNDSDVDGPSLSIASVTSGTGGTAVLNVDGTVTFTPNADFNGDADFTYTVTDGTLTSNTATVTVGVAAVNDAPVANDDSLAASEDTPVTYSAADLLGNDSDVDGPSLSIASVTSGTGGTAVLNVDGTVTFTPNADFNGDADFTYTVTDGTLTSNTATVTVGVAAVNDAPVANDDSLAASEDTPVTYSAADLLGNDSDVDGPSLSIASVTSGTGGTAVLNVDGTVTFTPNADFNGDADFTYTVTDGTLTSNTATVTVGVAAVNDAPVANDDSLAASEDTPVTYSAADLLGNDSDVDGPSLSIASVTSGTGGTAVLNVDGTVTFTPNADFNGDADFTYTVTDGTLTSNTATVTVGVAAVNDAPVANDDSLAASEDTPVTYSAADLLGNDSDVDGPSLSIASVTSGTGGTAVLNVDGTVTFTPNADFNGDADFTYTVTDGTLTSNTATVTVGVAAVNDAPVANDDSLAASEDTPVTYSAADLLGNDSDVDGPSLSIASVTSGTGGTAVLNVDGTVTFTPNADFNGDADFTYTVTDGTLTSNTATVTVGVAAVNDAPVANDDSLAASEDTPVTYSAADLLGNDSDVDGPSLSIASVTSGTGGTAVLNVDGTVTFTPNADFNGDADFTYTVTDGTLTSNTATVTVGVAAVNDAPVANDDSLAASEDTPVTYSAADLLGNDSDVDGPSLSIASVTSGTGGTAVLNVDGTVTFTPNADFNGDADFTYTVTDGTLTSNTATVTVGVAAVNDAPVANDDSLAASEDTPVTYSAADLLGNDSDVDGPSLSIASVTSGTGGTAVLNVDGTVTFTPNADFNGDADFTYTVTDGTLTSNTATVTVGVAAVNDAPVANDDSLAASEDTPVTYSAADLLGNDSDVDGPSLSIASVTSGTGGTAVLNVDGTVTFTPNADFNGDADFTYTVTDGTLTSNTATVTVGVAAVNDAPVANDDSLAASEDTPVTYSAADLLGNDSDVDGPSLSIASVTSGTGGTAVLNVDGTVTFTPNADFNGDADFTYTVTDGTLTSNTATVTVGVAAVNDAPVANDDSLAASEDTPVTYSAADLLGNDSDVDGPSLSIASVTSGTGGTAVLNVDGTVTFTPNADFNGDADFTYTVTDGTLTSNTATVTVGVAAVNDAPVANDDSLAASEDTPVTYSAADLLGNDSDVDGPSLSIASVTSGTGGTAVLNVDGTVTFTPNADFNGDADFTYTVTDGTLTSNTATVTVGVAAVNDAPVANDDSLAASEDTPVTYSAADLLGNDSDVDGPSLSIASVTSGTGGTAVLNVDGTVTFTPNADFNGDADFTYTVTDGTLTSNTATVTVGVAAVNDAPVANDDSLAASEDTPVTYSAADLLGNDSDVDGPSLSIASVTSGTGGTAVLNVDGTVTFTPNADFNGDADFTYTVTDGTLTSNTATVTVGVAAVNDAPVANDDSLAASEDTPVTYSAADLLGNDSDVDGPSLSIASVTSGTGGTAVLNVDGTVTFTPNADFNGDADFTYTVTDGTLTSNTATVTVGVAAVNDAPVANDDSLAASEDTPVTYSAADLLGNDSDVDGPSLSIASVTSGTGGTAVLNVDGTVTFTPNADFNGDADFTYTVTDGTLTSNTATVTVGVAAVNDAPVANDDSLAASEDTPVTYSAADLLGNDSDVDGPSLSIASVTSGTGGTAVLNVDGTVTFTPNADFNGDADFTYTVTDGTLTSNTATVTVGVAAVNDAPVANDDSLAASEDTPVTYSAADLLGNDSDVDGPSLSIASVTSGTGGTAVLNVDGTVTFTPNADFNGDADFTYTVTDGTLTSNTATVTVGVAAVNDAPVANDDSLAASEDTPVTYSAADLLGNDSDVDGPSLSIASVTSGTGGTAVLNVDGTVTFTPNADFNGDADFTYTVTDGTLTSNTATVTVGVAAVNDAPVANDDSLAASEDTPVTYSAADLLGNDSDVDGPSLSIASVTSGTGGTAVLNVDGTVTFTPNADFNGDADFTYTVTDGTLTSNTATVTVGVAAVNDAPVANDDSLAASEDTPVTYSAADLLGNDSDVDGPSLSIASVTSGTGGTAVLNVDGTVTFTPNADFNGDADFTYTVTDGTLTSNTATVTVGVAAVNDAPVANDDSLAASEDTPVTYSAADLLGNDSDVDGPSLSIASVTSGTGGTAVLNVDGTVTFTPNADFNGDADFTYTVTDGTLTSNTATVTVGVAAVNDAPVANDDSLAASEDTPVTYSAADLLGNDSDVDGPSLSIASVTSGTGGTAVLNVDGTVTFTPNADFNGDADFTYTVTDGTLTSNTATVTVGVAAVNDAPVANDDSLAASEDTPVTYSAADLLGNDSDVDGPSLSIASVTSGTGGTAVLNVDGTVTFTPNADFNGDADFTYTVTDGTLTSNTATVTVGVAAVNDAPVANDDSLAASEDTPVTYSAADLLGNDSDVDGPSLSIASVTSGTGGTAVLNVDGTVTFTPNADFNGDADFTYTVTDGTLTSNTATVTVGVAAVNDAPVANDDSLAASEDTPVTYSAADLLGNDSDVDGPSLSIASVTSGTGGTAVLNVDGTVTFTPNADFNGDADFTYTVTDGTLTSNTATVTVGVAAVNDAPVANDDSLAASEDTPVTYSAADLLGNDSDVDGPSLSIASVTSGTGGTAVLNVDGTVTFTPNADFNGDADFTYTVTDGTLTSNTATVTVGVAAVNDAPVANDDSLAASEDTPVTYSAADLLGNDSDVDGPSLSIASVTSGTGGTAVLNVDGTVTFTPNADFNGDADFTYTVTDGTLTSNTATVTVGVAAVNDAPTFDLDVDNSSGATGSDYQTTFTEGSSPVSIADIDFDITDIDGPQMGSATITLTNAQPGDALDVSGILGVGVSVVTSGSQITVTLTGPADQTVFESAINAITFENITESPVVGDRNINVTVIDEGGLSASAVSTVSVASVPTLSVSDVSVSEPEAVVSGSATVTGTIQSTGSDTSVDHWTFTHNGGALTIDAGTTSGAMDPQIRLFVLNPDGSLGAQVANDRDGGPGNEDAQISGNFAAGDYVLALGSEGLSESESRDTGAFPNGANNGGDYQVSFTGNAFLSGSGDTTGFPANAGTVVDSGLSATTVDMTYTITLDQVPTMATGDVTVNYEIVDGTANEGTDYAAPVANPGSLTFAPGETSKTITVTVNADAIIESNETVLLNLTGLSINANYDGGAHVIAGGIQGVGTILSADNPPEILNNSLSVEEGQSLVMTSSDLSAADADSNDPDLLFMMTNIEHGEFQLVSTGETITSFTQQQLIDGEIQFVHDGSELAPSYDVTVSDGLLIDTGSPVISFTANMNDAPVADDDTYNVFEDIAVGTYLGTVVASDPDLPAQPLNYTISGGDPSGLFAIDAYGNITLAGGLDFDAQAVHTLTVEVSDGTLADTATITVNVADQNAPIALDSAVTTAEDTQYVFTSSEFGFIDQDGDAMASVTITGLESVGSLRLWNGSDYDNVVVGDVVSKAQLDNGDLVFDAAPDDNGLPYDSFAFSVNDDSGSAGTTSATMTVNVTPVNDSPVSPVTDSDASINLVGEAALVGTAVGLTGLATDLDPEDSVSYQLINNPNGYFSIDPLTGEVAVASPLAVGAYDVRIRATSTDGTSSEETFTIQVVDAADDFATVHESALQGGTGRTESAFDDNDEPGQDVAAGNGTTIATGNLLGNDPGATGITEINGVTPVGGVITVSSANGQLVVDASTGDYTFTLTGPVDNSLTGDGQSALDSFSYTTNMGSADLNITIVDDVVQSNDVVTNVAEAMVEPYQLVFTLDVSGSMTNASAGGVVYMDDGSTTTRLAMAKDALAALATEYFSQSDSVELYLSTFESDATLLNGGAPYTDLQSALTAINGINGSGGTNYEAGLGTIIDALDSDGDGYLDNTASKAITYFISDGVPSVGDTSDPVGASGWDTFLANNAVDSYGVGIGAGINDFSYLDAINNVDADGSGNADPALNVSDVDSLESVLLGTVPASYGGSVVVNEGVSHVDFGADGGFIQSIAVELDTDADSTPDSAVTFVYDPTTGQISNDGGFAAVSGDILSLDGATYGFTYGTLIFNFADGSYSYFVGSGVSEGDGFSLDFVAADSDGDVAESSRLQMNIVDGKPVANNDVDTLFSNGTSLEGNVITAVGTDGGVALGSAVASFALQGSGVDVAIDDAQVSAVDYRGTPIDLTVDSFGSGTGSDGTSFNYTVSGGVLTLTNATDGSQLVFNTTGYYSYVPAELPVSPTGPAITEVFTDGGTGQGVTLSTNDGTVTYQTTYGAGIDDGVEDATDARDVDRGETLTIEFDPATYIYGVANVSLELYGLTGTYESFDVAIYAVNGSLIGQYSVGDVATTHTENLPSEYSNIGRIEVQGGSATEASIRQVSFAAVLLDTTSAGLEPEVIGYTLTDSDGQSDSAKLTLSTMHNTLVGDAADDMVTGTVANDLISGLDGDDILFGGEGRDILEGGLGNDALYGEGGSDRLVGDEGNDLLVGAGGNDVLLGGAGTDNLQGDAGADELEGGEGSDILSGGADSDTLHGNEGDDNLNGGAAEDELHGGTGNDILVGGDGNDLLFGNVGDDVMGGGSGRDTFVWKLNEQGTPAEPSVDVLTDFSIGEGDALDLSDLLVDEQSNELTDYLHFEFDADNNQTVLQIDQDGGMFFRPTQEIVLQGVDLTAAGSLTDQQIIDTLIAGNNLITD